MAWHGDISSTFLIEEELRNGRLQSIGGRYFPGIVEDLVLARRRDRPHGPVANRLWSFMKENVALFQDVSPKNSSRPRRMNKRRARRP